MHWLVEYILSHKNGTSFFVAILISLMLYNSSDTKKHQVAQVLGQTLFSPVQVTINQVTNIRNIFKENEDLRTRVQLLQLENASMKDVIFHSDELIRGISYRDSSTYKLISAQAVVREPTFLFRTIVIDAGRSDGVQPYMPVVTVDGVVGKVIRVMDRTSLVQLIRKPDEYVSVIHHKTGSVGILNASANDKLQVEYHKNQDIKQGDTLFTSGYGGIYPPGMAVGYVDKIEEAQNPLYSLVTVQSAVDFESIRHLFVVAVNTQWESYQIELDSLMREVEE